MERRREKGEVKKRNMEGGRETWREEKRRETWREGGKTKRREM